LARGVGGLFVLFWGEVARGKRVGVLLQSLYLFIIHSVKYCSNPAHALNIPRKAESVERGNGGTGAGAGQLDAPPQEKA